MPLLHPLFYIYRSSFSVSHSSHPLPLRPMKTELIAYKFLSFLLLPVAALLGFSALATLLTVLVNPSGIIGVAFIGSIAAYIITSFVFIVKCVEGGKEYRPKLVKWITITGSVTLFFFVMIIFGYIIITYNTALLKQAIDQAISQTAMPPNMDASTLATALREFFTIMMVLGLVLILHLIMSFRIIPKYKNQYPGEKMDIEQ